MRRLVIHEVRMDELIGDLEISVDVDLLEAGKLWLGEHGPLKLPKRATDTARIGWQVWVVMAHHRGRWHLLENGFVYP